MKREPLETVANYATVIAIVGAVIADLVFDPTRPKFTMIWLIFIALAEIVWPR